MADASRIRPTDWHLAAGPGQLYPLILDSVHEGVFTVDHDLRITTFNREAERIAGVSRQSAIGKRCYEVFRGSICQHACAARQTMGTGQPLRDVAIDVLGSAMRPVPVTVSTAVLRDEEGRPCGAVACMRDVSELQELRHELEGQRGMADIIGSSPQMLALYRILPDVASSDATVLVQGPSGTGKELVARALHELSPRRSKPFVSVNCGALPDSLLESELFGHVKGAFTGACRNKPGRFVQADGGTILLDEIGDVSPAFQLKLLRVLQEHEVQPLGSTQTLTPDVRVIAATNRDLWAMVQSGHFREDLYYRIRVVPITLPPLRERRDDVPLLVDHFVKRFARQSGKPIREVSPAALKLLSRYDFPGNIRELENIVERAFVLCRGTRIETTHLPEEVTTLRPQQAANDPWPVVARPGDRPLGSEAAPEGAWPVVARPGDRPLGSEAAPEGGVSERERIVSALRAHRWRRDEAARALGIARNTLWRRMKRLGIGDLSPL